MKITVPRTLLNAFRTECRKAYPYEILGVVHGTRQETGVTITAIHTIPHTSALGSCSPTSQHLIPRSKMKALRAGTDWLGTIHSHCNSVKYDACAHPSTTDIRTALQYGETIMGIVYVYEEGHKTDTHWYIPAPLPIIEVVGD